MPDSKIFDEIYANDSWGFGSGHGSLPSVTKSYRDFLQSFIADNDVKTVLDFGCGDWQFSKYMNWDGVDYLGVETVDSLVKQNQLAYGKKNIKFAKTPRDLAKLPKADLLIVKDVLQHLESQKISEFISKVLGKYSYSLITNNTIPVERVNAEISMGAFRPLDLRLPPFNLKAAAVHSFGRKRQTYSTRHFKTFDPWKEVVLLVQN